jgi:hypothetical protein
MNKTKRAVVGKLGLVLCSALLGHTAYGRASVSVGVSVGLPSVEIRTQSDFHEPLTPYGRWEAVGSYGRCWIPARVEAGWRPYCNGYWQRTDAGWYWTSDEPWAWATYHYGRWDLSPQFGWYWVPQTQWAPAWVSWQSGGGYIGWAPLHPSGVRVITPGAYVIVEERHFMEPVRASTVVVNNTTIINKSVIHEAPAVTVIEKASGRKVQALPVQQLRQKGEASVAAKHTTSTATSKTSAQTPARSEARSSEKQAPVAPAPPQVKKSAAATRESTAPGQQEKSVRPSDEKAQRKPEQPARENPGASEKHESNGENNNHGNKGKD